jgi:hypothetical protein
MMKIGFAVAAAAAVLMTAPSLVSTTPAKAQTLEMAQGVDVKLGGTATTATVAGGTTQTSPSASAQAASPSAHGKIAEW